MQVTKFGHLQEPTCGGLRLAAWLLGANYSSLVYQQQQIEKLTGNKIDIRRDSKKAIPRRLEKARAALAVQQACSRERALRDRIKRP